MFNIYMVHVTFKLNQGENIVKLCVFSLWPQFYELSAVIKKNQHDIFVVSMWLIVTPFEQN